jgi:hypothetical protein
MSSASEPDWHLRDWLAYFGKRQADLIKELGWDKARTSFVFNGKQSYRREIVNEIAAWLNIRPPELLMHPTEAIALRRLRETAAQIVAEDRAGDVRCQLTYR